MAKAARLVRRAAVSGVRLSHAYVGGRFIEDAYIYRVAA